MEGGRRGVVYEGGQMRREFSACCKCHVFLDRVAEVLTTSTSPSRIPPWENQVPYATPPAPPDDFPEERGLRPRVAMGPPRLDAPDDPRSISVGPGRMAGNGVV